MADQGETAQLAAYLRMLKDRTGRSFDALGRRAGVSGSSLHRYCAGSSVPTGFGCLHTFAMVCGATKEELRELQRLWALADASRDTTRALPEPVVRATSEQDAETGATRESAVHATSGQAVRPALGDGVPGGGSVPSGVTGGVASGTAAGGTAASDGGSPPDGGNRVDGGAGPARGGGRDGNRNDPVSTDGPVGAAEEPSIQIERDGMGAVHRDDSGGPRRGWPAKVAVLAIGAAAVLFAVNAWAVTAAGRGEPSDAGAGVHDSRLLFSPACRQVVSMGQQDECVREAQSLLKQAGARIAVDGNFGPETLRRVTAFQVLAELPPKGVVDDETKEALYEGKVSMETWSPAMVEQRIREVFLEQPDRAVAIADCQSYLDPLWVLPNTNGTRNWGVFQISDARLNEFRATPLQAFDPEWNIQAAHQLYKLHPDFSDWPSCARAARIHPMPTKPPAR